MCLPQPKTDLNTNLIESYHGDYLKYFYRNYKILQYGFLMFIDFLN